MTQRQFRILVVGECVVFIVALAVAAASPRYLPPELAAYLDTLGAAEVSWWDALVVIAVIVSLILSVVTTVGLWRFRRWARGVRLWTDLVTFVVLLGSGPVVTTGLAYTVASLSSLIEGGLLALMYLSPIAGWFTGKPKTPTH